MWHDVARPGRLNDIFFGTLNEQDSVVRLDHRGRTIGLQVRGGCDGQGLENVGVASLVFCEISCERRPKSRKNLLKLGHVFRQPVDVRERRALAWPSSPQVPPNWGSTRIFALYGRPGGARATVERPPSSGRGVIELLWRAPRSESPGRPPGCCSLGRLGRAPPPRSSRLMTWSAKGAPVTAEGIKPPSWCLFACADRHLWRIWRGRACRVAQHTLAPGIDVLATSVLECWFQDQV